MVCGIFQVHAAQIVSCKVAPLRSPFCEHNMALLCVCVCACSATSRYQSTQVCSTVCNTVLAVIQGLLPVV